jgi:hypothetical protein
MNNPFSPLERELITDFLREQGSSVRIRWNGGQLLLGRECCRFTGPGIIFSSPEIIPPSGTVTVELYFRKRGIWFVSFCRSSGGEYEIPVPAVIYKMDDGDGGKTSGEKNSITGIAETEDNRITFQRGGVFTPGTPPWLGISASPRFFTLLAELVSIPFPSVPRAEVLPLSSPLISDPLRERLSSGLIVYSGFDRLTPGEFSLYPLLVPSGVDEEPFDICIPLFPQDESRGMEMQVLCSGLNKAYTPAAAVRAINCFIHRIAAAAYFSSGGEEQSAVEGRSSPPELVFLDDSVMLLGGDFGEVSGGTLFHTEINTPGRSLRLRAEASSVYKQGKRRVLTLEFRKIQKEDRRFLFENCYGKKYTGI